jgi:hypothetical protein
MAASRGSWGTLTLPSPTLVAVRPEEGNHACQHVYR